ncbi:hypothetical protein C8R46DRAFT_1025878 [Mycena filopes]|nr:hypothetical protein C8R46DRAFT_1025878 [Mycena filopes]
MSTQELCRLTCVSKHLSAVSSNILFSSVVLDVEDLEGFSKALDKRFKSCIVRALSLGDRTIIYQALSDVFIEHLQKVLGSVNQIHQLHISVTMHTESILGYNMDPRYPEVVLSKHFRHLKEFHYTIQGEYQNGGDSIHLPGFLNAHTGLKRLKIRLTHSPYRHVISFAPNTVLTLPHLEFVEAPLGYFACAFTEALKLQSLRIGYTPPPSGYEEDQTDTLPQDHNSLPYVQDIRLTKTWGGNNIDLLEAMAGKFSRIRSLDIRGQYWDELYNDQALPLLSQFTRLEIFQYGKCSLPRNEDDLEEEELAEAAAHPEVAATWKIACPSLQKIRINAWFCCPTLLIMCIHTKEHGGSMTPRAKPVAVRIVLLAKQVTGSTPGSKAAAWRAGQNQRRPHPANVHHTQAGIHAALIPRAEPPAPRGLDVGSDGWCRCTAL